MTCNPIRAIPRNSLLGDQTKTRRFEYPIEILARSCEAKAGILLSLAHAGALRERQRHVAIPCSSFIELALPAFSNQPIGQCGIEMVARARSERKRALLLCRTVCGGATWVVGGSDDRKTTKAMCRTDKLKNLQVVFEP